MKMATGKKPTGSSPKKEAEKKPESPKKGGKSKEM